MRRPVNSPFAITTEFGVPDGYALFGYHSGVDYAVPLNRNVYAPTAGTVSNIVSKTGGNMVVIDDGQFIHRLMHNNSFVVPDGSRVTEGQVVAKAGTTGLSTGVHVHWDINNQGIFPTSFKAFISPADWLAGKYQVTQGDTAMKIGSGENWRWRMDRLHNQLIRNGTMSDAVFKSIIGLDAWGVVESWSSHPESDQLLKDQRLGEKARIENWSGKLAATTKQVAEQKETIAKLQESVNTLSARPTRVEYATVIAKVSNLAGELEKANLKLEEAQNHVEVDEQTVVQNWLVKLWNSLFKKG